MDRNITSSLLAWKKKQARKPLIVRGARQTGKSYSITHFGKTYFDGKLHLVNFEKRPDWHVIFEENLSPQRILSELEILIGSKIVPGEDLLFFDEIQACPKAITALRYFFEEIPELHIIAAGSLLEFAFGDIPFPVGRVQLLDMNPMTFSEFLIATGNPTAADIINDKPKKLSEAVHNLLINELRKFFFIGGMPECVKTFAESRRMADVFEVQSELMATFRQDFSKYAGRADKTCMNAVLKAVPQHIGQQIKYTALADGYTGPTIKNAFELLEMARIFKKVKASSPSGVPLHANASAKKFKTIFLDIGLLANASGIPVGQEYIKSDLLGVFRGILAEQFVGQEILAGSASEIFYWSREAKGSNAETDYLIEKDGKVIPVEVKSGKGGSLKSLHLLLNHFPNVADSYVFSDSHYGKTEDQRITFLPLYFAGLAGKK
jgi:uncharacterized protein